MTIDPNSLDPESVNKLIVEGLTVNQDGSFSASRIQTSDDPKIAQEKLRSFAQLIHASRAVQAPTAPSPALVTPKAEALPPSDIGQDCGSPSLGLAAPVGRVPVC